MVDSFLKSILFFVIIIMQAVSSPAAPEPPKHAEQPAPSLSPVVDGFKRTVDYWNELEKLAREVQSTVMILDNQATESFPGNNPNHIAYINGKLAEKYPGAKYDGRSGSVPLPNNLVAFISQDLKVTKITDVLSVAGKRSSKSYYIQERKFECNSGFNSIAGLVNKEKPSDSGFSRVSFTDFQDAVEKIFSSGPGLKPAGASAGVAVLNDAYQFSSGKQGIRMDLFAEKFLLSEELYDFVLTNARNGYIKRHPSGSFAADAQKTEIKVPRIDKAAPEEKLWHVGSFFIGLFVVVLLLFMLLFYGVRWFLHQLRSNSDVEGRVQSSMKKSYLNKKKSVAKSDFVTSLDHELCKLQIQEAYRAQGYELREPDGEDSNLVDLILSKGSRTYYLNYGFWGNDRIEAAVVKDFQSVVSRDGVMGGIMISPAHFSRDSWKFADETGMEIVSDDKLLKLLQQGNEHLKGATRIKEVAAVVPETEKTVLFAAINPADDARVAAVDRYAERAAAEAVEKAVARVAWGDLLGKSVALAVEKQVARAVDLALDGLLKKQLVDSAAEPGEAIEREGVVSPVVEVVERGAAGTERPAAVCILCGKKMRVGTVTKGRQAGSKFRVCQDYPSCKNVVPMSPSSTVE